MPTLAELFAPEVVWRVPGRSVLAKDYAGHEEVFGFFGRLMELTGGTFKVESITCWPTTLAACSSIA